MAIGLTLILHEHKVPDLNNVVVVRVHKLVAGDLCNLLIRPQVYVDFGAGAAGTGVSHFPEVVVLVSGKDVVCGEVF